MVLIAASSGWYTVYLRCLRSGYALTRLFAIRRIEMKTLGCLGIVTFFLFMTLFIPILHILTVIPFFVILCAFCIVAVIQLVKGVTR
jgi:hypothetical protein